MAKIEFDGIEDVILDFENIDSIPFDCDCSACGKTFQATQKELLAPIVTCPHCGAELEEV